MAVQLYSAAISESATYRNTVHNDNSKKLLGDGYGTVLLDEQHRPRSIKILLHDDCGGYAVELLRINFALWLYENDVSSAQATKLCNIANIFTTIVRNENTFTDSVSVSTALRIRV